MLHTKLCDLLGIEFPILVAPMGFVTGPALTAAVSNAGGFGLMAAGLNPPDVLRQQIQRTRQLTDKPFGVSLILEFPQEESVRVCLEEGVSVIGFYWGDPSPFIEQIHQAGAKVIHQVGTVEAARQSAQAGTDVIIAQGFEAGGHIAGRVALTSLLPRIVDAINPVPVAAAGGIADARGVVAALALGAEGVVLGTRFLATPESEAHPRYKERVLAANEEETTYTTLFGMGWSNAPHRVLTTAFVSEWLSEETRGQEARPDEPLVGETKIGGQPVPLQRFMGPPPSIHASGDIDSMALYAGQSVGMVNELKPAAQIMQELVEGANHLIKDRLDQLVSSVRKTV